MSVPAIERMFEELLDRGGTDLHLAVHQPPLARVRGEIVPLREAALASRELEDVLLELLTPKQRARLASELDVFFSVAFRDRARLRATYYVKHAGIAATFRVVPSHVPTLAELGAAESIGRLADARSGLLLVAGPASNGKTTAAAAIVDHVNASRRCHIVTIEEAIEFVHEPRRAHVTQREIGEHVPDMLTALECAGRENADVVFVSELSSPKEIELALRLASDGLLVIATIEASGAAAALERLSASFEPDAQKRIRALLADALRGVIVQHLIRSADGKSRVAVHEVVTGTPPITALVRDGATARMSEAVRAAADPGMQTLDDGLERLLLAGKITAEAALERAIDKQALARAAERAL